MKKQLGSPRWIAFLLAAAALLPGAVEAQGEEKKKPKGWLRVLPVGEAPPFRQEIRNGVRHELPALPGSIPPLSVSVPAVGQKPPEVIPLRLENISKPVLASAGVVPLKEDNPDGPVKPGAWHNVTMPERPAALALLWRDPREKQWSKARSMVLPDDVTTFPAGRVRIVNVSPYNVAVQMIGKPVTLKPGATIMQGKARAPLKQAPLKIAIADKGKWTTVYNSAISHAATERTNIVIYRADGLKPRRPAKVLVRRERAALPPLPRPKKAG